jgi:hypothetical protein
MQTGARLDASPPTDETREQRNSMPHDENRLSATSVTTHRRMVLPGTPRRAQSAPRVPLVLRSLQSQTLRER